MELHPKLFERMAEQELDLTALSRVGMMRQKQPDYYVMRLMAVAGDLSASDLLTIASVAEQYGRGFVHLSTRQGVEIHYVHRDSWNQSRQVTRSPVQLWKYSWATTHSICA